MKTTDRRHGKPGYVSYLMALSTGVVLSLLMIFAYKRSINALDVHTVVQMRVDYGEKEDAILRSIVAIAPNRAMQAMQDGSDESEEDRKPLRWRAIFSEALDMARARSSGQPDLMNSLTNPRLIMLNAGDSNFVKAEKIFHPVDDVNTNEDNSFVTSGLNYDLGDGFPVPMQSADYDTFERDAIYPIVASTKRYGNLAEGTGDKYVELPTTLYPDFNRLRYPKINIGPATPGQWFVAKRNWWAFEMDMAASGRDEMEAAGRDEIKLTAPRRKFVFSIYELPSPPVYQGGATGAIEYPVPVLSKTGRAALIPINRKDKFLDRFPHQAENDTVSPTTWNQYSVGALQCAMSLDIVAFDSGTGLPNKFRFKAKNAIGQDLTPVEITSPLSADYTKCWEEGQPAVDFGTQVVDVAYGVPEKGVFLFKYGVTGLVQFTNGNFGGNPAPGFAKSGYSRPAGPLPPFESVLHEGRGCVKIMPERLAAFLATIGAGGLDVNHSLVVNVDYTTSGISNPDFNPIQGGYYVETLPGVANFGMVVSGCANLSGFSKGFSIVSNLRTYLTENFNTTAVSPPAGYTPSGSFYPPVSLFVPEIASSPATFNVNLPINHPAELPPVFLKKWLVTLEELR